MLHINESLDLSPAVIIIMLIWGVASICVFLAFPLLPEAANSYTLYGTQMKGFSVFMLCRRNK